jgi:hypothetical protein
VGTEWELGLGYNFGHARAWLEPLRSLTRRRGRGQSRWGFFHGRGTYLGMEWKESEEEGLMDGRRV